MHFAGKRLQEQLLSESPIHIAIQRATQFHEFAEMVVGWTRQGEEAMVPPVLVQPVAAADVAEVLAEIVTGVPQGRATDVAGAEPQDVVDMARRTLMARGGVDPVDSELANWLVRAGCCRGEVLPGGSGGTPRTDHVRRLARPAETGCPVTQTASCVLVPARSAPGCDRR